MSRTRERHALLFALQLIDEPNSEEQIVADIDMETGFSEPDPASRLALLRQFVKNPRETASVAPSSRQLANLMASAIPENAMHIVEIGAGTGVITEGILRRGFPPSAVYAIEMNPTLHKMLLSRFASIHSACGDARNMASITRSWRNDRDSVDAICSSLGLLTMDRNIRDEILASAFEILRPGGVFVQYTYGFRCPLGATTRNRFQLEHHPAGLAWLNLPPARAFVYRQAGTSR
jgi:phosphatidylethanolamine/phosphatidyl-N-methylethanolamine N-methyltransferase